MEIIILLITGFLFFHLVIFLYFYIKKLYYIKKSNFVFLLIKIPKSSEDLSMQQNINIMKQVLKNLSSLYKSNFISRILGQDYISLEILVEKEMIKFIVGVPKFFEDTFEKIVSGFYPGAVIDKIKRPKLLEAGKYIAGGYFVLSNDRPYPIKTFDNFEADPMDSILASLRLLEDEKAVFQLLISPLNDSWQKPLRKKLEKTKSENFKTEIEKKLKDEGFSFVLRTLIISPDYERAKKILDDIKVSLYQYNNVGFNKFVFLETNEYELAKDTVLRCFTRPIFTLKNRLFYIRGQILNISEVASIYHFPHPKINKNPNITWQKFKIVPAPDDLPKNGILLGYNLYGGIKKEIYLSSEDRFRHFYIIGQTGTGKSTMLLVQSKQDLYNGNGFCLIDPHGDLCEFLLKFYPKNRVDDLIYFDAGDTDYPIGFNILEAETEEEKDIVTNDLVEIFIQMYGPEIFGPRIQDYFRNGVLTLMDQPEGGTLVELVRLFVDDVYQHLKLKNLKNPAIKAWWQKTFASMGQREKEEMIPYFQSKFGPFTTTPIIRNIIGQPKSSFNLFEAMQSGKVILVNLSKGRMGELNSKLLGSMLVTQIKLAALRRAKLEANARRDFFLYIDEFQNYITQSIETILSEARKYRLGLIIAHQYISQLYSEGLGGKIDLRGAVFGNVGSLMVYRVGAEDAEFLEKFFLPDITKTDLINLDKFKGAIKLSVGNSPSKGFSLFVLNPYEQPLNDDKKIQIIKEISRLKRGRKKELVEKEILYRIAG